MIQNHDLFKAFLNLYWLRPENAATSYFQSQTWLDINLSKYKKTLDIAGGDGCYIFLHLGGRFDDKFDFFTKTNASNFKHSKFVDIYNISSNKFSPKIIKKSKLNFNTVTDWKSGLLDKAKKLKIYKEFILHDNNKLPLPFYDEEYDFVHSNAVYWTSNAKDLLKDISRVTKKNGTLVMEVATNNILGAIKKNKNFLGNKLFNILDRKRSIEMKMLKAKHSDWSAWMKNAGLIIEDIRVAWPNRFISDSWDYGITRPISHLLINMTEKLSDKKRVQIKREWVKIFYDILVPFCEKPKKFTLQKAPYITYILRKK
jgi:SAM-dependent methyltransferase